MKASPIFLLTIVGILTVSTVMPATTMVFAQIPQLPPQGEAPDTVYDFGNEASPETKQMLIDLAIAQIRNFTDPSISLSEDGSLSISQSSYDQNGNYKLSMVMVQHPFTTANGYNVDNGVLVAPNGTQVFP